MKNKKIDFSNSSTTVYTQASWTKDIDSIINNEKTVIITDNNIAKKHKAKFANRNVIVLRPGEKYKQQATVDAIISAMIAMGCDRQTFLLGVGGGVITDITGYTASIFMRGISFGFAPTSLLAMVDASIGGKNGVDVGIYKNIVGNIRQPGFLFYDVSFLDTLPMAEWRNGFAEIIKHGAILDKKLYEEVATNTIATYQKNTSLLEKLISKNVAIKTGIVQKDEFEKAERKLLNFGHTLGHAIENTYELSHGEAISIGMVAAAYIAEQLGNKPSKESLITTFTKYGLPTYKKFEVKKIMNILLKDKKKTADGIHYIILQEIGKAAIHKLDAASIKQYLQDFIKQV